MKSLSQSLIVLMTSILISGCMCMMPMDDMRMNKKEDMGMTKRGERGGGMQDSDYRGRDPLWIGIPLARS